MMRKRAKTATLPELASFPLRRSSIVLLAIACVFLFLIASTPLHGLERSIPKDYALIFGTVWGPDDLPVPGMKVKIRKADDKDGKARWEVYSNSRGEFEQRLPVGKQEYVIWADIHRYKSSGGRHLRLGNEVRVTIQSNERADTGLHLQ